MNPLQSYIKKLVDDALTDAIGGAIADAPKESASEAVFTPGGEKPEESTTANVFTREHAFSETSEQDNLPKEKPDDLRADIGALVKAAVSDYAKEVLTSTEAGATPSVEDAYLSILGIKKGE